MTTATRSGPRSGSGGLVLVIIAGLVVVGAGAAGWFLFNKSEPEVVAEPAPAPAPTAEKAPPPAMPSNKPPQNEVTVTPTTEPAPAGDKKPPREYYVDGKLIRDHRSGDKPPIDLPPVVRPPDARAMKAQSTSVLTKAMRIVLRDCVRAIPPEERTGEKPRVEAVVAVSVKDRAAKVTKSTVQLRDVRGSAADAAKSCIENNILSVQEGVDEADIESYDITTTLSF